MKKEDLLLEQWKMASELHRHMDNMAWQALNFFIAANSVLLTIFGAIAISDRFVNNNPLSLIIAAAIPLTGTITSLLWGFIQRRQQLYQYYRVLQAKQAENDLKIDGERILTLYQKNINEQELIPVPKFGGEWRAHALAVALAFSLAAVWFCLLVLSVYFGPGS